MERHRKTPVMKFRPEPEEEEEVTSQEVDMRTETKVLTLISVLAFAAMTMVTVPCAVYIMERKCEWSILYSRVLCASQ